MDLPPQVLRPNAPATAQGQVLRDAASCYIVCVAEYASHPEIRLSGRDGNQHGPRGTTLPMATSFVLDVAPWAEV